MALTPDPFPEQNIFVRSDHYRFVQQGVPSVFLVTGTTSMDGKTDTKAIFEQFLKDHYHTPSDDLNLPIDYGAAARFTRINARIGEILGNRTERPRWHEGDFFIQIDLRQHLLNARDTGFRAGSWVSKEPTGRYRDGCDRCSGTVRTCHPHPT